MKPASRKAQHVGTAKGSGKKIQPGSVFIGARKSGSEVIISREITRRSGGEPVVVIRSTRTKLPKKGHRTSGKVGQAGWMQDPKLGDILTAAFTKAVKAAKRRSKLHV